MSDHKQTGKMVVQVDGRELILERVFNAPRELVFKAYSEAEHLKHWWGPRGWELTVCHIDFRPGGVWHYCMTCTDKNLEDFYGFESWGKGVYEEIIEPEKIVYVDYFSDAEGNESESMPSAHVTMEFEDHEGKTKLISRTLYDSEEALKTMLEMGMEQGIAETWDRFAENLENIQQR